MKNETDKSTMKCPCGFDSSYTHDQDSYAVGEVSRKSGLHWVPLMDGGSVWLCNKCIAACNKAAMEISGILKCEHWTSTSVLPRQ